jgi:tetratricopeptide (TPR) repeat protein
MSRRNSRVQSLLALLALLASAPPARAEKKDPADALAEESNSVTYGLKLIDAWQIEEAEAFAKGMQQTSPDDLGTKYLLGRIAFEEGDYTKAAELLKAALGPGAAQAQDYQLAVAAETEVRGTVVEESAHFTIRYKPGKDAALVPYAIETMEAAYAALTKDLNYEPPKKTRIEFYSSPKALARVSSLSEQAIKTTGTIALCKYNRLMVTSPRALWRGYEWQDTITHEFTHFLVSHKSRNTVPIWIHEGIAKYLETRWRGPAGLALDPGGEALLAKAVRQDKLIPFARMHPSIAMLPSQEDAATAFAEVFTAIEFVDKRKTMAGVRAIIDGLREGKTDRDAVADALGMTFEQFEAAWKRSLKARPTPKAAPAIEKLVFKDERKTETRKEREKSYERGELGLLPNTEAKQHAHLGELLRARNRLAPACLEYEAAIKLVGAEFPALARKYALTKLALGQGADAEAALRTSLKAYPDDETNHLLLGRVLVHSGRAAEAKEHLLTANQRDPFDEEIHAGLVEVGKALGDSVLVTRETDVLHVLAGDKLTWRAPEPGKAGLVGYLRIEAPNDARVFVDGVDTGLTTPVAEHPLSVGAHVVKLVPGTGEPIERTVQITPDALVPFPQS